MCNSERRQLRHAFNDDAICTHCGFNGAEDWWLNNNLRLEIGEDEFTARQAQGDFDSGRYCPEGTKEKS